LLAPLSPSSPVVVSVVVASGERRALVIQQGKAA
jgi:hypothetical protein